MTACILSRSYLIAHYLPIDNDRHQCLLKHVKDCFQFSSPTGMKLNWIKRVTRVKNPKIPCKPTAFKVGTLLLFTTQEFESRALTLAKQ